MTCPMCEKDSAAAFKPFCSKRCADLDLAKWLNGSYALPSTDPDDAEALFEAMDAAIHAPSDGSDEKLH